MMIYAMSKKGYGKEICQDSMLVGNSILSEGYMEWSPDEKFVVAIADGVGGANAGEEASFQALKGIRDAAFFQGCTENYITESIGKVNENIVAASRANPAWERMATTLTGIYLDSNKGLLFHVGNTRLFCLNGQYLCQLTEDHTNVNFWVSMGMMTRQEAENHPRRNEINACIGGGDTAMAAKLEVKNITEQIQAGKPLLLTTDGIHDYLSLDEMEAILGQEESIKERLSGLIDQALANGSKDDISVIYIRRDCTQAAAAL